MVLIKLNRNPIHNGRVQISFLFLVAMSLHSCCAFMFQSYPAQTSRSVHGTAHHMTKSEPLIVQQTTTLKDKNDAEFSIGCTIQLCSDIRAYQVPAKARGYFSSDKKFVQLENSKEAPRKERCLVIPTGMRAKVTRIYDIDACDATQPVLVKFEEGESFGGDFICPGTFMMHFDTYEVEVV